MVPGLNGLIQTSNGPWPQWADTDLKWSRASMAEP